MFEHRDQRAGNELFLLPKGGKVQERKDRIKKKRGGAAARQLEKDTISGEREV